jgi:hypothetical protein
MLQGIEMSKMTLEKPKVERSTVLMGPFDSMAVPQIDTRPCVVVVEAKIKPWPTVFSAITCSIIHMTLRGSVAVPGRHALS